MADKDNKPLIGTSGPAGYERRSDERRATTGRDPRPACELLGCGDGILSSDRQSSLPPRSRWSMTPTN
jgi:hypothetical protein